jgi:hypothetical protein
MRSRLLQINPVVASQHESALAELDSSGDARTTQPPGQGYAQRLLLCILLAAMLSGLILQYSIRHGRLIQYPTFDDVAYLGEGMVRLRSFYDGGFRAVWREYLKRPPHSPYGEAVAALAFALFGPHDWAPYLLNGVLALGLFVCADRLLGKTPLWQRACWLLMLTSVPYMGMAVHEFRPDHAAALLTAAGIMAALCRPAVRCTDRHKLLVGSLFGLAMWVKPPVFPATTALFLASLGVSTLCDRWIGGPIACRRDIRRAWLMYCAPFVLIPLPHYIVDFKGIVLYIREILFGTYQKAYQLPGGWREQLSYYLTGAGGRLMLGNHVYLLAILLMGGCAGIFARGSRVQRARLLGLLALLAMSFAIPLLNRTKQPFFGLTFDILLTFIAFYLLGKVLPAMRPVRLRGGAFHWEMLIAPVFAIVALAMFQWPTRYGNFNTPFIVDRSRVIHGAYDTVLARTFVPPTQTTPIADLLPLGSRMISRKAKCVIFGVGDANPALYNYWGARDLAPVVFFSPQDIADLEINLRSVTQGDFLVISEPGSKLIADFLPSYGVQGPLLDKIRHDPDFQEVGRFTFGLTNKSLFVFQRMDFFGWEPISGFGPFEGPTKQFQGRVVTWAYGPNAAIRLHAPAAGNYNLSWHARNRLADQQVTLVLDGKVINQMTLGAGDVFVAGQLPLKLKQGAHDLEFQFSQWDKYADRPMALLFKKLRLEKVK